MPAIECALVSDVFTVVFKILVQIHLPEGAIRKPAKHENNLSFPTWYLEVPLKWMKWKLNPKNSTLAPMEKRNNLLKIVDAIP
jgi:hypothetical protein